MKSGILLGFIVFALLLGGCSEYRKVLKSTDMQYKYDKALEYYKSGKYAKSYPLFEELYIVYRGTEKGEKIAYYQANCDYKMKDFILAAHRFEQFYKNYPSSVYAEECQFMSAYCNYKLSPKFSLDQTDTYKAIRSFQLFTIQYPDSRLIDSCNQLLDELRFKIEYKEYRTAKLYYRMENYRAAVVSFGNFNNRYPNSAFKEETWFLSYKASYLLAVNSIEEKKVERIGDAMKAYVNFADRFPESARMKDAESLYEDLQEKLEIVKS